MNFAHIAILALSAAAPVAPNATCTPAGSCTVPEFGTGNGMKANSPPPVMVPIPARPPTAAYSPAPPVSRVNAPEPLIVMPSSAMNFPLAVADAPRLGPGRHKLVVHWPDARPGKDFEQTFEAGEPCLKARAAVLDEHRRRTSAIAVNMANRGTILAAMLEAPYAVCLPLD
jgi:hypothetical protein